MADHKLSYPASSDLTYTSLASLASSSTWVAGAVATAYDNTTNLYPDVRFAGSLRAGTTPTAGTYAYVWVFAELKDGTWPDSTSATDAAKTWTSVEIRDNVAKLAAPIYVNSTTSNRDYPFDTGSIKALFNGILPRKVGIYIAHNMGAALNASNSIVSVSPVFDTVT